MSAASIILEALKRPTTWAVGVIGTFVTTHITNLSTPVEAYLSEKVSPYYCEYRQHGQKPISDGSQFNILVSRLTGDPWLSRRDSVMRAFQNETGFYVTPICDSFSLDYSMELQARTNDLRKRAMEVIKARNADLLLFGEVPDQETVLIYAVNDHGDCDLRPRETQIKHNLVQGEITEKEKENLVKASLEEVGSACMKQSSYDWRAFAKRINKIGIFLNNVDFSQESYLELASAYIDATRLLYQNDQGDNWFSDGEKFSTNILKFRANDNLNNEKLSLLYNSYANLLCIRFAKTNDQNILDAALADFDKAIDLDPKNAAVYANRGYAYSQRGNWDRAITNYDKAIELEPKNANAYSLRGNAYSQKGSWDSAFADYGKAIDLEPKNAVLYNDKAYAYSQKGDWDGAIADYGKAIKLEPKNAVLYSNRGYAYSQKGDWDRAFADYDKAIDLDPKNAIVYSNRGYAYSQKGDWDRAIADYGKAIDLEPKNAFAYDNRSDAYLAKGDIGRAFADFDHAIGLDPTDTSSYTSGPSSVEGGMERAIVLLDKAHLDPMSGPTGGGLTKKYVDRAIVLLDRAIELDPKNAAAYRARGDAYLSKDGTDRAIADFDKAVSLDPKNGAAYRSRGYAYLSKGDRDRAFADYGKAIELDPKDTFAYGERSYMYEAKGDLKHAFADFRRAIGLQPQ